MYFKLTRDLKLNNIKIKSFKIFKTITVFKLFTNKYIEETFYENVKREYDATLTYKILIIKIQKI